MPLYRQRPRWAKLTPVSELRDLRTLRERVEEGFKRADYPSQLEVARRMFQTEGVANPTSKQIADRARQIGKWRKTERQRGWGIGDPNARLLALALGLPDDSFVQDRASFRRQQQEDLAAFQQRLEALEQEVTELRRRVS